MEPSERVSHPLLRVVGLALVLAGTPIVRFVSCFSIGAAVVLAIALEPLRAWALLPEIPLADLRRITPRCSP
jgi:hypothetical protein